MKDVILVLSNADDRSTARVADYLSSMGKRFLRFDTETFPAEKVIELSVSGKVFGGCLRGADGAPLVEWADIRSVWYRRPAPAWLDGNLASGYVRFIQEESAGTLWSLYTTIDAFWMNPPLVGVKLLEQNKLYQLRAAADIGITTPDSLITNNPDELLHFADVHGGMVAVKAIRGGFFKKEGSNVPLFVFTQQVSAETLRSHVADIRLSPLLAQAYVPKELEFRVTMVGDRIFACAIHSQDSEFTKHDWRRYDFGSVKHERYQLPEDIEKKLLSLMKRWGLVYGAIDMVLTPSGEYVFLEINPNGQWEWIEEITGMPISMAMAEVLADPPN